MLVHCWIVLLIYLSRMVLVIIVAHHVSPPWTWMTSMIAWTHPEGQACARPRVWNGGSTNVDDTEKWKHYKTMKALSEYWMNQFFTYERTFWNACTTLQSMMNAKLSKQRFWHCYENGLIKTIQTIPHNLYVSVKLTSLYCGLRLILVYPNPQ